MPLQPGNVLHNRYRIVRLLGQGGFGAVYRAWDINLNKACAVKENLTSLPEAQRQFQREARVLANLTFPNLPRVVDHFAVPDQGQYLVMDFVDGEDLRAPVERGERVNPDLAMKWIGQVADALTYLHTRTPPVVHRDVKPANIRITPDGRAMLVDFGIFKFDEPSKSTTMGARAITPGYSPPEQYGRGRTDARTDIYALAATLYALLTGIEPVESVLRIGGSSLPGVSQLNPSISSGVSQAIHRAMELEPDHRYQAVSEFMGALEEADATMVMQPVASQETLVSMQPLTVQASAPQEAAVMQPPPEVHVSPAREELHAPLPETKQKGVGRRIAFIILFLLLLGSLVVGGLYIFPGTGENVDDTSDQIRATVEAGAQATNVAGGQTTATARAVEFVEGGWTQVFGPQNGVMVHDPSDDLVPSAGAAVDFADFAAQATFINPYATDVGSWDYGFVFRHAGPNRQYRLIVRSDRTWLLRNNDGQVDGEIVASGTAPALALDDKSANHLELTCKGERGEFFVNDVLVAELDLSARQNPGDVYIVTGVLSLDEVGGFLTEFRNFSVWSVP